MEKKILDDVKVRRSGLDTLDFAPDLRIEVLFLERRDFFDDFYTALFFCLGEEKYPKVPFL